MMVCDHKNSYRSRSWIENGEVITICDKCVDFTPTTHSDCYWPGHAYKSEALGVEFTSREQKAAYLKEKGLSEAGDIKFTDKSWIEGSRDYRRKQFDKERPMIREIYRRWKANNERF